MSAKSLALAALMLAAPMLAGCAPQTSAPAAAPAAPTGKALAAACADRDGWSDPAPPAKLFGNTYYVGTCGITALLIDAPAGPILIEPPKRRPQSLPISARWASIPSASARS